MHSNRNRFERTKLLLVIAVAAACGCTAVKDSFTRMPGMGERDWRPGLADVRVLGSKGQKCYDFCASAEAACKQMCPTSEVGECRDDCLTDTKDCLEECPELWRPPRPEND